MALVKLTLIVSVCLAALMVKGVEMQHRPRHDVRQITRNEHIVAESDPLSDPVPLQVRHLPQNQVRPGQQPQGMMMKPMPNMKPTQPMMTMRREVPGEAQVQPQTPPTVLPQQLIPQPQLPPVPQQQPEQRPPVQVPTLMIPQPVQLPFPIFPDLKQHPNLFPHLVTSGQPFVVNQSPPPVNASTLVPSNKPFNPWSMSLEELQALVHEFRTKGKVVLPNGDELLNPNTHPPVNQIDNNHIGNLKEDNPNEVSCQTKECLQERKEGEENQTNNQVNPDTDSSTTPDSAPESSDSNRRRSLQGNVMTNAVEPQVTTIKQVQSKFSHESACTAFPVSQVPDCVKNQAWLEIVTQKVDCMIPELLHLSPRPKPRVWTCYCGFFEDQTQ